jgi:hypothetical protein
MKFTRILISLMFIVQSQFSLAQSEIDYLKSIDEQIAVQKAFDQVAGDCTITQKTFPFISFLKNKEYLLTITRKEWTGTCTNGFAEGEGRLSMNVSESDGDQQYFRPHVWQGRGRMVHGKRRGPWLIDVAQIKFKDGRVIDQLHVGQYEWNDALFPGVYMRTEDGNFRRAKYTSSYNEKLSKRESVLDLDLPEVSSAMVNQQMQAILDRTFEKKEKPTPPVQLAVPMLVDLLPGGLTAKSPDDFPNGTHRKNVALILSSGTSTAFQKLAEFRKRLLTFAQSQSDDSLRQLIENFANVADERLVSREIAAAVRYQFKSVKLMNDLPSFLNSGADYAIVIDFQFEHSVDKIIEDIFGILKGNSIPGFNPMPKYQVKTALSYVLLNPTLEVVSSSFNKSADVPGTNISGDRSTINFSLSSLEKMMEHTFGSKQHNAGSVPTFVLPIHYALRGQRY